MTMLSPTSVAAEANTIPIEVTPDHTICTQIIIEHYTLESSQEPRNEHLVACGNHTTTAHFLSNHTHVRTTERNIWSGPAVDNDR